MRGKTLRICGTMTAIAAVLAVASGAEPAPLVLRGTVMRVVEGDTLQVRLLGGRREGIRLIGIDTPELRSRQCFAAQARARARRLAAGRRVRLIGDSTQGRRDRNGRLLAYLVLPTQRDLGRQLIAEGFGKLHVGKRPFRRLSTYQAAERAAKTAGRGLWRGCGGRQPAPPPDLVPVSPTPLPPPPAPGPPPPPPPGPPPPPPPPAIHWPENPFPLGSIYNPGQPIPANVAIHPNSANIVNFLVSTTTGGWKLVCCDWAVAVSEARGGEKSYVIEVAPDRSSAINRWGGVPIPSGTRPDPSEDGHLTILDYALGRDYSFWQAHYDEASDKWTATCGSALLFTELHVDSGCGANTANMPGAAGLITPEELQAGYIGHPLVLAAAAIRGDGDDHVCPAGGGWGETSDPNAPVAGQWLQMDPTLDVAALAIPDWQKTILRALQEYGAFIRDQSATDTTFLTENPLNRVTLSWATLTGVNGNPVLSSAIPWDRMRVLSPPCAK